jgi:hypothetical protein
MEDMRGLRQNFVIAKVATVVGLSACSPTLKSTSTAHVNIQIEDADRRITSLSENEDPISSLPNNFCFMLNVTGPGIRGILPEEHICGPENGLGQVSLKAFNAGDSADITVRVGTDRVFELVGFESPLGSLEGKAICGALEVAFQPAEDPLARKIIYKMDGQEVRSRPWLFARGHSTINPSKNNSVVLTALQKPQPYFRKDFSEPPSECRPQSGNSAPLTKAAPLFVPSGIAITQPKVSASGRVLRALHTPQAVTADPKRSRNGNAEMSTGILHTESSQP